MRRLTMAASGPFGWQAWERSRIKSGTGCGATAIGGVSGLHPFAGGVRSDDPPVFHLAINTFAPPAKSRIDGEGTVRQAGFAGWHGGGQARGRGNGFHLPKLMK